jgi:hypothetical protein
MLEEGILCSVTSSNGTSSNSSNSGYESDECAGDLCDYYDDYYFIKKITSYFRKIL